MREWEASEREAEAEAEERRERGRAIFTSFPFHSIPFNSCFFLLRFSFSHLSSQNLASWSLLSPFSSFAYLFRKIVFFLSFFLSPLERLPHAHADA
jgi:hypothetical protein